MIFDATKFTFFSLLLLNKSELLVISREIRPLAALYPPPKKNKKSALQDCALRGCRGRQLMPTHLRPFLLYQSKKYIWGGGYNSARGLISRDIAELFLCTILLAKAEFSLLFSLLHLFIFLFLIGSWLPFTTALQLFCNSNSCRSFLPSIAIALYFPFVLLQLCRKKHKYRRSNQENK